MYCYTLIDWGDFLKGRLSHFIFIVGAIFLFYGLVYLLSKIGEKSFTSLWNTLVIFISIIVISYFIIPGFSITLGMVCSLNKYGIVFFTLVAIVNVVLCSILLNLNDDSGWLGNVKYLAVILLLSFVSYFTFNYIRKYKFIGKALS